MWRVRRVVLTRAPSLILRRCTSKSKPSETFDTYPSRMLEVRVAGTERWSDLVGLFECEGPRGGLPQTLRNLAGGSR